MPLPDFGDVAEKPNLPDFGEVAAAKAETDLPVLDPETQVPQFIRGPGGIKPVGLNLQQATAPILQLPRLQSQRPPAGATPVLDPETQLPVRLELPGGGSQTTGVDPLFAATVNTPIGLAEGAISPLGFAATPFAGTRAGAALIRGVFGALAAKQGAQQLGEASVTGDVQKGAEGALQLAAAPAITGFGGRAKPLTERTTDATRIRPEQEHIGTPPGTDVPTQPEEVRPGSGEPDSSGGGAVSSAEVKAPVQAQAPGDVAPPSTKPETALEKGIKSGFVTNEGLSVIPGLNAGEAALLGEILVDPSQQIPPEALSRLRNKLKQVKAKPPSTAGPVLASGIDSEGDPYHLTEQGTYQRKGGKWQLTDAAGKKTPVIDADTIAKLEARAPKPPTEEPPPTEPTAPHPTTPTTEPAAPAEPAAAEPTDPEPTEVVPRAKPTTQDYLRNLLQREAKRIISEEEGQAVLDDAETAERTPDQIAKEFFEKVYPYLPTAQKARLDAFFKASSGGMEPGQSIGSKPGPGDTRVPFIAENWMDILPGVIDANRIDQLQGTSRGLVSVMEFGNKNWRGEKQARVKEPRQLAAPSAVTPAAPAADAPAREAEKPAVETKPAAPATEAPLAETKPQEKVPVWKVSYTDLETRAAKRPFFNQTALSEGATRKEAIERVQSMFGAPKYGEFRASKAPEGSKADYHFTAPKATETATPAVAPAAAKVEAELKDADEFTSKAATVAEKAVQEWAIHVEDVVNPLKAKIRKAQAEVGQMQSDAKRTTPEVKGKQHLTKKAFLEQYGVASMEDANALFKQKNAQWADLEKQLEAAEQKRKDLEVAKERRSKEWSAVATRAGELRRQVYPKVKEGDISSAAAPSTAEKVSGAPPGPGTGEGPGSPAASEVTETGPRGEPTHGIAARVSEQRRLQGVIAPVEPGEGVSAPESVEHGRALLEQGADPQRVLDEFNRTKAVTADGMAVVRAHGERLAKAAYAAADRYGIHSPEYEAAWEADSGWTQKIKPMQTEWHKIGQAQQGEVEIDTGTFHGLRRAFKDATGKDFTPAQADEAVRIAKGVKEATEAADKAKEEVFAQVGKEAAKPVEKAPPASKPGQPAKPQPITLWKRAKAILDAGETDFDAIRHKLAIEFGIPVEEVTRILAEPKVARTLTDDMYRKMSEQRRLVSQAKNWLKNQEIPGWQRFIRAVPRVFFTAKIFGHGTVGMITHAGLNIFNPGAWRTYWPNFFRQYKLMVSPAYHERMMQDLIHDPLYTTARRAGLVNDAFRYQDDYQTPQMAKWLGRIGLLGNRGFDALKLFRQARFSQIWNGLPDTLKTKDQATLLADSVNHATGAINMRFREWANWTFFAPKLEGSRWAWMVKDPLNAAKTFLDWGNATPEQRSSAMSELKQKAAIAGTYYGLLALNQGLLSASGSDDKINFSNPKRGDFMAFKAAGHNVGIVSPMLGMVRLFANLVHATMGKRGKLESLTPRAGEVGQKLEEYARGKLSPFASFGADVVSQADFQGRPMPYSTDKTPAYLRRQGIGKYTYGQYAAQEFTPIPVSEAIREVWRDQGMKENDIDSYLKALLVGVVTGGTGARVSAETPAQKKAP